MSAGAVGDTGANRSVKSLKGRAMISERSNMTNQGKKHTGRWIAFAMLLCPLHEHPGEM